LQAEYGGVLERELAYHEQLYSGFAQRHFARPAVRALRAHMVSRILRVTGAGPSTRVLSLGCGIGDTEILLAPRVGHVTGIDLSGRAIRQAVADARAAGLGNTRFLEQRLEDVTGEFDLVIAIFFLHHLPWELVAGSARIIRRLLARGGRFYSLDPNRRRLSGMVGRFLMPGLMRRYQSPDERELDPEETLRLFLDEGFSARREMYDFFSSPLAGLLPGSRVGYRVCRVADEVLRRVPGVRRWGSNFEIVAAKP
jgi:SAM-dependent methyltransferase